MTQTEPSASPQTKTCTRCKQQKPHPAFYRHSPSSDGLRAICKECYREAYLKGKPKLCPECRKTKPREAFGRYMKACMECREKKRRKKESVEGEKTCSECRKTKPRAEFYHHATSADGRMPMCKACINRSARAARVGAGSQAKKAGARPAVIKKTCERCGKAKPCTAFETTPLTESGYTHACAQCLNQMNATKKHKERRRKAVSRYE